MKHRGIMIFKAFHLASTQRHLREKFLSELRTNGFKQTFKKVLKKTAEHGSDEHKKTTKEGIHFQNGDLFSALFARTGHSDEYIKRTSAPSISPSQIKLIAFYLPQFHPIPQNDAAWGKGFTEWTNVSKAVPQFLSHHQPKLPSDLGFYDLRLLENQKEQIEIAKEYGIYGFCYHHYWFDGKRIMDTPVEQILAHPELNFPFCINWANENWTRRWDGYDSDVLLAQNHSDEDDILFIADAARYLKDPRYIRVEGKPLLMLYRPALLPDAKATALRWRQWCRDNGVGEIYLVTTHSFEHIDPNEIGFDAAVEFTPNSFPLRDITEMMRPQMLNPDYRGTLYDYESAIEISRNFSTPAYEKFRAICPDWDNEARKPGRGTTLIGSTPAKYGRWLQHLCDYTKKRFEPSKRFIFVNAWNEWAEGAYLEPDRRYGYAYLEATRAALMLESKPKPDALAVVIHAFYPDVFSEILEQLKVFPIPFKLFVTLPAENQEYALQEMQKHQYDHEILVVENRGRDILPFLKILPKVIEEGYSAVLKLHTKKSRHRDDGNVWRNDLFSKLISASRVQKAMDIFAFNPHVGLIGPENHIVNMETYWGSNKKTVLKLADKIGVNEKECMQIPFIAGTMFYAKIDALTPLLNLHISENEFEVESGQVDGTMAHALERFISLSAFSNGLSIRSFAPNEQPSEHYRYVQ